MFWMFCIVGIVGYALGYHDGRVAKPPPPLRGDYDSGEHGDRVDDYGDWQ
jgi:hypothetical protein